MRSDIMVQFIRESWDYDRARDDVHRQTFLLRWILDQIPLMEAEMRDTGSSSSPALDASDLDGYYEIDPDWQPSAADSRSNNHHYNDDDNDDGNNNYNYDNNNSSNNNNILPRLPPLNLPATEPPRTLPSFPPATDSFPPLAEILRTGLVTQSTHSNSYISVPPDQSVDAARTYRSAAPSVESLASTPSRKRAAGSPANDTAGDPAPSGETALQQQPKRPKVDQQQQEQRQQQQSTGSSHSLAQQQEQQHHHQPQQQQPTNNDATTYDRLQPADHSPGPVASQAPRFGALPSPSGSPSPLHL
ncbi:hypothetical protein VTK73DRAFT_4189 [Phialemonium thermophilum]|uniref:Uncharacterized protein n=1 Tax=Phialemonium thermophilum TaxID=223376 RepID=A0ABR3VAV6_9PEZI